ncbi:MAG: FAD:protein FMN transferase [Gammaproteobacteria bacterium]|nr:MAG: FAD:protein FMN transferase [Gammaproteobacteria bacterium]
MGTQVRVEVWHENETTASRAIAEVMAEMRRIDAAMSPFKPGSLLSRINRDAGFEPVVITSELLEIIGRAQAMSRLTKGAFDITFASAGHLYNYRHKRKPTDRQLKQARQVIDYRLIQLDPETKTIRFTRKGVRIDLGGIAKGYAVDRGIALLKQAGMTSALVSAGGDSRILGDRRGRPWMMGVRDPNKPKAMVAILPIANEAISTSGDYERYFDEGGQRYHHILNPRTGTPVQGVQAVTVIGPDAMTTDAWSTSLFVLGVEAGLSLVNQTPGLEAIIIDARDRLHASSGLQRLTTSGAGKVQ